MEKKLIYLEDAIEAIRKSTEKYTGFMSMEMYTDDDAIEAIKALPTQPEIIRCKDCKYYRPYAGVIDGYCYVAEWYKRYQYADDFCSRAERGTDG